MDIELINKTIEEFEHKDTTILNCQTLAALYIVREHFDTTHSVSQIDNVEDELDDILPEYTRYKEIKRKYQMRELSESALVLGMQNVCREIKQFVQVLYSSTDIPEEREQLKDMVEKLQLTIR